MMGVSTSKGILTMVVSQDKLSCVNDSCLSVQWLLSTRQDKILVDFGISSMGPLSPPFFLKKSETILQNYPQFLQ